MSETRSYPRHVKTDAGEIEFRLMSRATRPRCWRSRKSSRRMTCCSCRATSASQRCCRPGSTRSSAAPSPSLLAVKDGAVVGCGTLVRDPHSWSPHVGEIRMVVSQDVRGQGVGRALSQETFASALGAGLEKLSVQMTVDQQAAIALFESLGFKAEALLRDHVRDVDGKKHDIVVLGPMWRRCGHSWKPTGCRGAFSTSQTQNRENNPMQSRWGRLRH